MATKKTIERLILNGVPIKKTNNTVTRQSSLQIITTTKKEKSQNTQEAVNCLKCLTASLLRLAGLE